MRPSEANCSMQNSTKRSFAGMVHLIWRRLNLTSCGFLLREVCYVYAYILGIGGAGVGRTEFAGAKGGGDAGRCAGPYRCPGEPTDTVGESESGSGCDAARWAGPAG